MTAADPMPGYGGLLRRQMWDLLGEAENLGPYDERPLLPSRSDLQVMASRNDRPQPFHLICEKDTVLATLAGTGAVHFHGVAINRWSLGPGDWVYVPALAPHRIVPSTDLLQLRYKPASAGLEATAWYCQGCGTELWRYEFDTADVVSQDAWMDATERFNGEPKLRTCAVCGTQHPTVDLDGIRWRDVAEQIRGAT